MMSGVYLAVLIAMVSATPTESVRAAAPDVGTDAQREAGKQLYSKYCSQCHGEKGDGEGPAAPHLRPRPRNFTTGKFKVRTTPNGALPTHQDLVNIIRHGMPYTSMPAWPTLSDQDVSNLAYFITTFSPDFSNPEKVPKPVTLPSAPGATKESVEAGKKLYEESGCLKCHGTLGRGDGPSAPTLKDDWGHAMRAADLAQPWTLPGRLDSRGYLQDDEHGVQRHADAVVRRRTHARATMADHGLHPLALGEQRAWVHQPRRRHARQGSDRSVEGSGELHVRSRGSLSDHRADHGARALVPSSRNLRDRSGHLRC